MYSTAKILATLELILVGIAWIDYVDIGIRILSGLAAVIVGWFAIQAYRAQKKLSERQFKELVDASKSRPQNGRDKKEK